MKPMANLDIKERAKKSGVFLWQIADELGITDSYFSRKLRREFPESEKKHIFDIIDRLKEGEQNG